MGRVGFHEDWIDLIMKYVTTVKYRIKVNGEISEEIIPQHGLRQGDPLSLSLSIFSYCVQKLCHVYCFQLKREGN